MQIESRWQQMPVVTRNLIVINFLVWLADAAFQRMGIQLDYFLGLMNYTSGGFLLWQPITYMFMHANFWHIFCNMLAVYFFAPALEERWGSKRFLIYYLVCGLGAALVQELVWTLTIPGFPAITIGASGAVFGILFAFGWLYPSVPMFIMFIPVPVRARVFVIIYAIFELFEGISGSADSVAHFAHLGGFIFGWLLILWWRHRGVDGVEKGEMVDTTLSWRIKMGWKQLTQRIKNKWNGGKKSSKRTTYHYQEPINHEKKSEEEKQQDEEISRILDKVKKDGYSSLSDEEKHKLFDKK